MIFFKACLDFDSKVIPRLLDKSEIFGLREEFLAALIRFVLGDFSFGKYAE